MTKATNGSLLALAVLALLAACSKKDDGTASPAPPQAPAAAPQVSEPHPAPSTAPADAVDLAGIARAEGGKTIAEVYAEKDQLAGQTVTFRGKVVKVNAGIMDKNWLHVRDGSGTEGANDLTVTTPVGVVPNVGDTVLVTGQVALDKDFGMGYQYGIIVEDAEVSVE